MSDKEIIKEIERLERTWIPIHVSGDFYTYADKGKKQLERDRKKAELLRKAVGMD